MPILTTRAAEGHDVLDLLDRVGHDGRAPMAKQRIGGGVHHHVIGDVMDQRRLAPYGRNRVVLAWHVVPAPVPRNSRRLLFELWTRGAPVVETTASVAWRASGSPFRSGDSGRMLPKILCGVHFRKLARLSFANRNPAAEVQEAKGTVRRAATRVAHPGAGARPPTGGGRATQAGSFVQRFDASGVRHVKLSPYRPTLSPMLAFPLSDLLPAFAARTRIQVALFMLTLLLVGILGGWTVSVTRIEGRFTARLRRAGRW